MKTRFIFFLLSICLFLFTKCGIYTDVYTTVDKTVDFSKYRTFAWLPDDADSTNSPYNNEIIRNNIRNYFGQSFAERGYSIDLDNPDILLQISVANQKIEKTIIYPPEYYSWPYFYSRYYYGSAYYSPYEWNYYYRSPSAFCYPSGHCAQNIDYVEGSITLNVFDNKQNKLVWTSTARGDIYDPAYINKNIHPAVKSIMNTYPVKMIIPQKQNLRNNGQEGISRRQAKK